MTLTTHALVGAAAAQVFPQHPYVAFAAGFVSHFAIDALPHWDYADYLPSIRKNPSNPLATTIGGGKQFARDVLVVAADALLGAFLSVVIFSYSVFHSTVPIVLIGAAAGIYADFLQAVYFKWKASAFVLEPLQRFHTWVQKGKTLYVTMTYGLLLQALLVLAVILVEKFFLQIP